MVPLSTF